MNQSKNSTVEDQPDDVIQSQGNSNNLDLSQFNPFMHHHENVDDDKDHVVGDAIFRSKRFPNSKLYHGRASGIVLVYRGNKNQCVFEYSHPLKVKLC